MSTYNTLVNLVVFKCTLEIKLDWTGSDWIEVPNSNLHLCCSVVSQFTLVEDKSELTYDRNL